VKLQLRISKEGSMSGRPEIRNKGNSSKESAAAEIPAARSVQEVLAGGGFQRF
jgi:hypothetical protein